MAKKVLIIGLDCAPPEGVFEEWRSRMPNISKLMDEGAYGPIASTIPPITCPAWMAMATSKNPGKLGCFGFRNRRGWAYTDFDIANSTTIREPTIYQILSRKNKKVVLLGVPQTYPPKPVNGIVVTSFLAPDIESNYTYPPELKEEIAEVVGEYIIDCKKFRTEDKKSLLDQIYEMTEKRFKLARHFLKTRDWDLFQIVEMGTDRIHHGFWKFYDKEHFRYEPGNEFEDAIPAYYEYLDGEIGALLDLVKREETAIIVVSDHGVKRMDGAFCINDWLIQEGYLKLRSAPPAGETINITKADVDWPNTTAWAFGGYYGRLFMNVKGRESHGVISPSDYERVRTEIKKKVEALTDHKGRKMRNVAHRPQDIYSGKYVESAPDLIMIFDELYWRVSQDVGHASVWSFETEIGPDDATHSENGMFLLAGAGPGGGTQLSDISLYDVAPTILEIMEIEVPEDMEGQSILQKNHNAKGLSFGRL